MHTRSRPIANLTRDRRRRAVLALGIAALLAPALLSGSVLAKGPGIVRVDPPIDLGAAPETWLDVRFEPFQVIGGGGEIPWTGSSFVVRLVPVDATAAVTRFPASERPVGSGQFVATVIVPDSGLSGVEIGLLGERCVHGACTVSDLPFELTPGSVVRSAPSASQPVVPAAGPDPVPAVDGTAPFTAALLGAVGLGAVGLAAVWLRTTPGLRSRPRGPDR